jgi:methionyl-tRNA formyltransferase
LREDRAPREVQNAKEATYFGARSPEDGRLDWSWPARRIHNMVRALTRPYPGAFTFLGGKKLYVWKGAPAPGQAAGQPGKVFGPLADGIAVVTGEGLYVVKQVGWEMNDSRSAQEVLNSTKEILCAY